MKLNMKGSYLLFFLLITFFVQGQNATEPLSQIRSLDLDSTKYGVTVYHPQNAEKKAQELGPLMADALEYHRKTFGTELGFRLALLERKPWKSLNANIPYGIPYYLSGKPSIAIIPSRAEGVVYDFMLEIEDEVAPELKSQIKNSGYTYKEFAAKMLDLIGFHEIGHAYMIAYGINTSNHWLNEFVANYLSYAFLKSTNPELADLWDLSNKVILQTYEPNNTSLEVFNEKYIGVGVSDYAWYQSMFENKANKLFDKAGEDFIKELREEFPAGDESLDDNKEVVRRLEKIEPGFIAWSKEF